MYPSLKIKDETRFKKDLSKKEGVRKLWCCRGNG